MRDQTSAMTADLLIGTLVDPTLEVRQRPGHKLNGALSIGSGYRLFDIFGTASSTQSRKSP